MKTKRFSMARIIIILFLMLTVTAPVSAPLVAYAKGAVYSYDPWIANPGDKVEPKKANADEVDETITTEEDPSPIEKTLSGFIVALASGINLAVYATVGDDAMSVPGIIMAGYRDSTKNYFVFALAKNNLYGIAGAYIYMALRNVVLAALFVVVAYNVGMTVFMDSPRGIASLKETVIDTVVNVAVLYMMPLAVDYFCKVRDMLGVTLYEQMKGVVTDQSFFELSNNLMTTLYKIFIDTPTFLNAMIYLAISIMPITFMGSYVMIAITETVLFGLFPLMLLMGAKDKKSVGQWAGAFFTNLMIPPIDMTLYCVPLIILDRMQGNLRATAGGKLMTALDSVRTSTLTVLILGIAWYNIITIRNLVLNVVGNSFNFQRQRGLMGAISMGVAAAKALADVFKGKDKSGDEGGGKGEDDAPDRDPGEPMSAEEKAQMDAEGRQAMEDQMKSELDDISGASEDMSQKEEMGSGTSEMEDIEGSPEGAEFAESINTAAEENEQTSGEDETAQSTAEDSEGLGSPGMGDDGTATTTADETLGEPDMPVTAAEGLTPSEIEASAAMVDALGEEDSVKEESEAVAQAEENGGLHPGDAVTTGDVGDESAAMEGEVAGGAGGAEGGEGSAEGGSADEMAQYAYNTAGDMNDYVNGFTTTADDLKNAATTGEEGGQSPSQLGSAAVDQQMADLANTVKEANAETGASETQSEFNMMRAANLASIDNMRSEQADLAQSSLNATNKLNHAEGYMNQMAPVKEKNLQDLRNARSDEAKHQAQLQAAQEVLNSTSATSAQKTAAEATVKEMNTALLSDRGKIDKANTNIAEINKNMDKAKADHAEATATLRENTAKNTALDKAISSRVEKEQRLAQIQGGMHEPHNNPRVYNSAQEFKEQLAVDKRMAIARKAAGAQTQTYSSGILDAQAKFQEQQKAAARSSNNAVLERMKLSSNVEAKQKQDIAVGESNLRRATGTVGSVAKVGANVAMATAKIAVAGAGAFAVAVGTGDTDAARKIMNVGTKGAAKNVENVKNDISSGIDSMRKKGEITRKDQKTSMANEKADKYQSILNRSSTGKSGVDEPKARNEKGHQGGSGGSGTNNGSSSGGNNGSPEKTKTKETPKTPERPTTPEKPKAPEKTKTPGGAKSPERERFDENTQKSGKSAEKYRKAKTEANKKAHAAGGGGGKSDSDKDKVVKTFNEHTSNTNKSRENRKKAQQKANERARHVRDNDKES